MKSILMSIKPYCGFLIIAKEKCWDLAKYGLREKSVEVRKGVPTSPDWDKKVELYFSKDKKSLARIPEEYRGEVAKLCGKVVGEFVCDKIEEISATGIGARFKRFSLLAETCLPVKELNDYLGIGNTGYGWHISDLKIYNKPKELSEFAIPCNKSNAKCITCKRFMGAVGLPFCNDLLTSPPKSWCYVEELK